MRGNIQWKIIHVKQNEKLSLNLLPVREHTKEKKIKRKMKKAILEQINFDANETRKAFE